MSTYDVRIWAIREYKGRERKTGKPRITYRVRWEVAGKEFGETFQTKALAESFRSKLLIAQREGVAFDEATGLPEPMARELNSRTWYEHAVAFVDVKWSRSSPRHRTSIAESLAYVTPALVSSTRGAPTDDEMRRALFFWSFNKTRREAGPPPTEHEHTIRWLVANTVKITELSDAALVRKALDTIATLRDGRAAAANTVTRKRGVFYGALRYAVELRLLLTHPMDHVQWTAPRSDDEVDRRSVVNPKQALQLLDAVSRKAPRLVAFFACMYYAALRPFEVLHLRVDECELPESGVGTPTADRLDAARRARLGGRSRSGARGSRTEAPIQDGHARGSGGATPRACPPVAHRRLRPHSRRTTVLRPDLRQQARLQVVLRVRLAAGAQGRTNTRATTVAACGTAVRLAARRSLPLAQRWGTSHPDGRVGRAQRARLAEGLREVHRRTGRGGA